MVQYNRLQKGSITLLTILRYLLLLIGASLPLSIFSQTGKVVVPCKYDYVYDFSNDLTLVKS
jgi:hypothetical protein